MTIKIKIDSVETIAEKRDVSIIYLKSGKFWVCKKSYTSENGFIVAELAKK